MDRALEADGTDWTASFVIVHGMSGNRGMRWSPEESRRWLQREPADGIDVGPQPVTALSSPRGRPGEKHPFG